MEDFCIEVGLMGASHMHVVDSLAERSKAPDSSSGGAIRVGSNPTAVIFILSLRTATGGREGIRQNRSRNVL